ncbi:hypothetical protein C8Q77DRAFT_1118923 [Trametes polyzona]|nr:hypothetical protein C8Q77DRAFT_1118923 [Trametes polyzona]
MAHYSCSWYGLTTPVNLRSSLSSDMYQVSQPGAAAGAYGSYVTFFISPLSCLLTSRMMLDLYETNARIEAGADSTAGLFSLTLNNGGDRSRRGSLSMPEFVTSYGGPTHSLSDDERDDGDNHDEDTPGAGERSGNGGSQEAEGHPRDAGSPEPHAAVFTAL